MSILYITDMLYMLHNARAQYKVCDTVDSTVWSIYYLIEPPLLLRPDIVTSTPQVSRALLEQVSSITYTRKTSTSNM